MLVADFKIYAPFREADPNRRKPKVRVTPKDEAKRGGDRRSRGQGRFQEDRDGRELDRYV